MKSDHSDDEEEGEEPVVKNASKYPTLAIKDQENSDNDDEEK